MRIEKDSLGAVSIPDQVYWGAQTQRAVSNFPSHPLMPRAVIKALAQIKQAAALVNSSSWSSSKTEAIIQAAKEVAAGKLEQHFPLSIWQSGSGTQTNMNVNEVIANRSCELLGGSKGDHSLVHPNDDVNRGQSTNDSFSTAIHLAALESLAELITNLEELAKVVSSKANQWQDKVKVGRTHLQDAVPISYGQVFSGYSAQIKQFTNWLKAAQDDLYAVAQGGTAVGTGVTTKKGFDVAIVKELRSITGLEVRVTENKFASIASHDQLNNLGASLGSGASLLIKIANDLRFLASGPRCGLGELVLPENEPGSSIMPGKVNPSQIEMLLMVCYRVTGNQLTVSLANSSGFFELNTAKPILIFSLLESMEILAKGINSFTNNCLAGIKLNHRKLQSNLERSLMQVTNLSSKLGYDKAAQLAQQARAENKTIKQLALAQKLLSAADLDNLLDPSKMISPNEG